ncbi:MAG: glycosyltransferase family 2 protein [Desulfuromonadales bacterium]|nr:MAG: glycosyltransferase family 2 protein [Desulfuromonadales bacterium]
MIMKKGLVTFIVVNWNGEELLADCLNSLENQTYQHREIIFVDNGSLDGSLELVRQKFPSVRIVPLPENRGFAGGNNAGLAFANGEFIAVVNTDVVLDKLWLDHMIAALTTDEGIGVCAARIMIAGTEYIDSIGEAITTAGNAYKLGEYEVSCELFLKYRLVGASAAAATYRRSMLDAIGFFDDDFYVNVEDSDLHMRAWLAGWKCKHVPESIAYHHVSSTIGRLSDNSIYYLSRNTEWLWLKNMPFSLMARYVHHRLAFEVMAAIHFCLILRKWRPYINGKMAAFFGIPHMIRKRRHIQGLIRLDANQAKNGLVSLSDFVRERIRHAQRFVRS